MFNSIRQKTIVKQEGRIEVLSPELPIGATVEVVVLIEPSVPNFSITDKKWLESVKPVKVDFSLTEEWLEQAKCEGRE
ncbi:hypothetical protein QUF50_07150 [Thiotrichales bacterium HSG1]|nr:hypothetical protein [Thiotrichales bacterium HSG1]